jgi:hypothetical protein
MCSFSEYNVKPGLIMSTDRPLGEVQRTTPAVYVVLFKREEAYLTLFGHILKILSIPEMCGVDPTV